MRFNIKIYHLEPVAELLVHYHRYTKCQYICAFASFGRALLFEHHAMGRLQLHAKFRVVLNIVLPSSLRNDAITARPPSSLSQQLSSASRSG